MVTPKRFDTSGSIFIGLSGFTSIIFGIKIKALFYDVCPGGKFGHIGVLAGLTGLCWSM